MLPDNLAVFAIHAENQPLFPLFERRRQENPIAPDDRRRLTNSRKLALPNQALGRPFHRQITFSRVPVLLRSAPAGPVCFAARGGWEQTSDDQQRSGGNPRHLERFLNEAGGRRNESGGGSQPTNSRIGSPRSRR